jgi:hypothetical protein
MQWKFLECVEVNMDWSKQEMVRLLKGAPGTQYQEGSDTEKAVIRDWVRGLLQKHPVTIVFVKADGSDREMRCTLNGDFIPAEAWPGAQVGLVKESRSRRQPDKHSLRVWDMDLNAWRSFRYERLKKVVAELRFD